MRRNQDCKPSLEIRGGVNCSCNSRRQYINWMLSPFKQLLSARPYTWSVPQRTRSFIYTFRSFCISVSRRELPRLLGCFWSHQGVQCSLVVRFHKSHLLLHQPLTPFPNFGAGMGNLTLLSCRAEVSPFTDVGCATCSRGTVPYCES